MRALIEKTENDMSKKIPPITVTIEDAMSRDLELERAASKLRESSSDWGILVTRVDFTTFTVALSPDIPFGFTRELDLL